jgi:hypothetical protein
VGKISQGLTLNQGLGDPETSTQGLMGGHWNFPTPEWTHQLMPLSALTAMRVFLGDLLGFMVFIGLKLHKTEIYSAGL